ncbi:VOC family protein [Ferrovibrio sp.]|uniref:VOC family protein n=1 Tax=Ferrovibrio sp. TaxID=1917215 RepID=UPI0035AD8F7C
MLRLDHLTVIAPTLAEGMAHLRACLDLDLPFGQRHEYMGTHNHLLRLGGSMYLEVVAIDPDGAKPPCPRWFGLDDQASVRAAWDSGRRLRGWVARSDDIHAALAGRAHIFGRAVSLPWAEPAFEFSLREDGGLPLDGAAPSLIDRRGKPRNMATIPDLGARLDSFALEHPDPAAIAALYESLQIDRPPTIMQGDIVRYRARIATPGGVKELF